jgi:ABC-type phosphate/phosphonate transport system substrate-binding protein
MKQNKTAETNTRSKMFKIENLMRSVLLLTLLSTFGLANEKLKVFNVAYMADSMSNYSKKDLKITMDIWLQELSKNEGYDAHMFIYDDPKEAVKDLEAGKIDYISAFPLVFVKYFDLSKLDDGFSGVLQNHKMNDFVVLVRNEERIKSWRDIKNPRVGIQKNDEIMHLYAKYKTNNLELPVRGYTKRSKTILDLFFNKLDVALVPLRNFALAKELNPQIRQKIKILEVTKLNATNLGFFRKTLDEEMKEMVYNTAKRIFVLEKGKQMMMIFKVDKLSKTKLSDLNSTQEFYKKYQKFEKEARR